MASTAQSEQTSDGLRRFLGPVGTFFVTVSCLSPSIAVFIVGDDVMRHVGTGVVLCFAAAALFGIAMACVYGELGSAFPGAGGEYTIFRRVFGQRPANGVLGLNLLGFCISLALSGFGVATYLGAVWPGLPVRPVAAATIVVVTGIAILHVQVSTIVTACFLLTELAALAILTGLGAADVHQPVQTLVHPVIAAAGGGVEAPGLAALGAGTAAGIYAFNGYGAAIFFGEDMHDARRHTARVVLAALAAGVVMVMPPIVFVVLGTADPHALSAAPAPILTFVKAVGGRGLSQVMSLGVALAIFNTMIAIALMAGRQLYATGRDGLWPTPVSRALAAIHRRWGSPWIATLVVGGFGLASCLLDQHVLVLVLGNGAILTYAGVCLAALRGRRGGASAGAAWRMPAYPFEPIAALVFLSAVVLVDLRDPGGRTSLLATGLTVCAGLILFPKAGRRGSL